MKYKGAFEEKAVGCVLWLGLIVSLIAVILIWVFSAAGVFRGTFTREAFTNRIRDAYTLNLVPLCILLLVVGLLMIVGALGYGFFKVGASRTGIRRTEPYLRVLNRTAYDGPNLLMGDEYDIADNPRFYVKVLTQQGVVEELEASVQVFLSAGEGMVGEGQIQGNWLGRFIPYIGGAPPNDPQLH